MILPPVTKNLEFTAMKKNKIIYAGLVISLLAVSCSKEAGWETGHGGSIGFAASDETSVTRGTPIGSAADIPNMGVFAYYTGNGPSNNWAAQDTTTTPNFMNHVLVTNNAGAWSYANPVYWPGAADANVSFFSYSPYANAANGITVNATSGIPSISYTVPTNCSDQPDLMVSALRADLNKSQGSSPVNFQMRHVLTSIGFKAVGQGKITKIEVQGAKTSGTLTTLADGTFSWNTSAASAGNFEATVNGADLGSTSQLVNTGDGYLMMIPQTLPAGAKLIVSIDDGREVEFDLGGRVWAAGQRINYSLSVHPDAVLLLSPDKIVLPPTGGFSQFEVTVSNGSPVDWTLSASSRFVICDNLAHLQQWAAGLLSPAEVENMDGSGPLLPGNSYTGSGNQTLYVWRFAPNPNNNSSITVDGTITQDGNPAALIDVVQLPNNGVTYYDSYISNTYVGAFWKAGQKGERIIRMPIAAAQAGSWDASVLWTDGSWKPGDIVFSTAESSDAGITWNNTSETPADMNNAGSDALYNVPGYFSSANGTAAAGGEIYFRIGLTSAYAPTENKPARYALVLVRYNNSTKPHLIFLRQGDNPDYLMAPTDANATGTRGAAAVRFSPYNTTATTLTTQQYVQIAANRANSKFTDYPSQAGAFFQWASIGNARYAYSPVIPIGAPTSWATTANPNFWEPNVSGTYESCPDGYHRPNDGPTNAYASNASDAQIATSQLRQSLYSSPPVGNSSGPANIRWGFYADGFFDRRAHNNPSYGEYGEPNTAVSWQTKDVGYIGALFYNPVVGSDRQYASLFFPAAGHRISNDGSLQEPGAALLILSSSTSSQGNGGEDMWYPVISSPDNSVFFSSSKRSAFTLRCVRNN